MAQDQLLLESLERLINEIDALEAIYGTIDAEEIYEESSSSSFCIISKSELEVARNMLTSSSLDGGKIIPTIELEIKTSFQLNKEKEMTLSLRCRLVPGYPELPALVSAGADGIRRSLREELTLHLTKTSESMAGSESMMALFEELKEIGPTFLKKESSFQGTNHLTPQPQSSVSLGNSRRWIWVHHITNTDRRKSIVTEANDHKLGGYLKYGYPGVIVIEGPTIGCDEFVSWVKGNKSRPGGFGRNWGHHVRGQVDLGNVEARCLPSTFEELEDMALLGSLCREHGLEEEFLEFVMQHKAG